MSLELYNRTTAVHYLAYRPPIHKLILADALQDNFYDSILDIGCGTGTSTQALLPYCNLLWGYDPSEAMIEKTKAHSKITYTSDFPYAHKFDLLSFFGSLNYINLDEMKSFMKVLPEGGSLLCCDFVINLKPLFDCFGLPLPKTNYQPDKSLSGLNLFSEKSHQRGRTTYTIQCTSKEVTHLLLGDSNHLQLFQRHFKLQNPTSFLTKGLQQTFGGGGINLIAQGYWDCYTCV